MYVEDIKHKMTMKIVRNNSILLGALIVANLIAGVISMFAPIPNIFAILVFSLGLLSIINSGIVINVKLLFVILIILIQFIFSFFIINSETTTRFFISFITIGIPSIVIASKNFDFSMVIKSVQILSLLFIPFFIKIISTTYTIYDAGQLMGIGYATLPIFLISILTFVISKKVSSLYKILAIFNLLLCSLISVKLVSRGFFLCIFFFVVMIICDKLKDKPINVIKFLFSITLFIISYFVFLKEYIINTKLYYSLFETRTDLLNGRDFDLNMVLSNKPFFQMMFGSGIGSYQEDTGLMYIHNIIGMIYYEQGLVFAICILLLILISLKRFFVINNIYKYMILLLLSASIVRLAVSYYFWIDQLFWVFITMFFLNNLHIKTNVKNYKRQAFDNV